MGQALNRLEPTGGGTLAPPIELGGWTLTHERGTGLGQRDGVAALALQAWERGAWLFVVIVERGRTSPAQPRGSPRWQRPGDRKEGRGCSRPSASGAPSWRRTTAADISRHDPVLPCQPLRLPLALPRQATATPCLPAREPRGCGGSEQRGRTSPGRTVGTGRRRERGPAGPRGASPRGGKGFPRPAVLASHVRLCSFRHPWGAMVWALLRGLCHGPRGCCGTRHSGVIRGGGRVVWPGIALVTLAMRHTKDLWEGRRHRLAPMPAVGDLRGRWRPWPTACGRGCGAVPGDQLAVGMGWEARGHGCSRASCKHVQGAAPLASDEKGAVALAVAPCPGVDAKACRCRPPGQRHPTHTPTQGLATHWGARARPGASAGSAAEHQPRVGVRRGQSRRRARRQRRDARQSLGTGLATTRAGTTTEATPEYTPGKGRCRPWEVGKGAPRVPMEAIAWLATSGTGGVGGDHRGQQDELRLRDDPRGQRAMVIGWQPRRAQSV
jgi:hypothetical protein